VARNSSCSAVNGGIGRRVAPAPVAALVARSVGFTLGRNRTGCGLSRGDRLEQLLGWQSVRRQPADLGADAGGQSLGDANARLPGKALPSAQEVANRRQ